MSGFLCTMVGASFTVAVTTQVLRAKKTVTASGNAQVDTAQSKFGGSSYLGDGTGDYLIANNVSTFLGDFTIECWFRTSSVSSDQYIITADGVGTALPGAAAYLNGNALKIYSNQNGSWTHLGNVTVATISTNTWYHLSISRSGTTWYASVNGTITNLGTYGSTISASGDVIVGALTWTSVVSYVGHIDEVRVSNIARYTANFTAPTAPFVNDDNTLLLIHADGTDASTVFTDDNGIGRSQKGITAIGNAQLDTAQSKFGGSSYLGDGSSDNLTITPDGSFAYPGDFTVEAWVRPASFGNAIVLFSQGSAEGSMIAIYASQSTGQLIYYAYSNNRITGSNLSTNTWYHIAVSRSGNSIKLFLNGTQVGSTYTDSTSIVDAPFYLGSWINGTSSWSGHIDEVRVSNNARYTSNFTPSTTAFVNDSNTLLLLHMDGTDASTVFTDDNAQLTITPAATNVNEGSSLTFNVSTVNTADQTLYWTVTNSGDFSTSTGSFSLASNAGSFSVTPTADTTTEGAETFTASVRIGSTSGDIIATTPSITINDTSVATITYPSGVEFQRASSEKIRVRTFSSNVSAKIQVCSYWFKLASSPTGDEVILYAQYDSDGNAPLLCELTGGNVRHYVHTGNSFTDLQYTPGTAFAAGTWYHIVTKSNTSGSGKFQVWLNGVKVKEENAITSSNNYSVGSTSTNSNGYGIGGNPTSASRLWNGCIAQVYWYGGDIDIDTNISKFYNNGVVDFGTAGTTSGLPTPHIYHYGSTQATFDDVRGSLGGSSVTVTGTLSSCS